MFEWVSFRGNYTVHKKVLLNCVIFNKQSQLYSAFKMNNEQMFDWVSFRGNYAVHNKSIIEPRNFQ